MLAIHCSGCHTLSNAKRLTSMCSQEYLKLWGHYGDGGLLVDQAASALEVIHTKACRRRGGFTERCKSPCPQRFRAGGRRGTARHAVWQRGKEASQGTRQVARCARTLCPDALDRRKLGARGCSRAAHCPGHWQQCVPEVTAGEPGERRAGHGGDLGVARIYCHQDRECLEEPNVRCDS